MQGHRPVSLTSAGDPALEACGESWYSGEPIKNTSALSNSSNIHRLSPTLIWTAHEPNRLCRQSGILSGVGQSACSILLFSL
jgi:hypothetical protein